LLIQDLVRYKSVYLSLLTGDLGGFYGLLLGGSAISLFEVLDVIIYNALIKLAKRRRPNGAIEPSHPTHVMQIKSLQVKELTNDDRPYSSGADSQLFKRAQSVV
jgi:hypothetical protein